MSFVISEDLANAGETKIHRDTCIWFARRNPDATTMAWHGPFADYEEARATAARIAASRPLGYKDAGCCMRNHARRAVIAQPVQSTGIPVSLALSAATLPDGTYRWKVAGQPVAWAGENPEKVWRQKIIAQSPKPDEADSGQYDSVSLIFHLRPDQVLSTPDLDNLMVPVLEELRNLGWFQRGFPTLDYLLLRKTTGLDDLGVTIHLCTKQDELKEERQVIIDGMIREGNRESSEMIEKKLGLYMLKHRLSPIPSGTAVRLQVVYMQRRPTSIMGMLKSTIDGMEPLLGRTHSANSRSRFFPADERVTEIVACRMRSDHDEVRLGWSIAS